jgi:peptidoglycan hydrolase-like protein with peptidoglycan-binding domain
MTERDKKLAIGASLLMMIGVAINMAAFQTKGEVSAIETGGLPSKSAGSGGAFGLQANSPALATAAPQSAAGPSGPAPSSETQDVNSAEVTRGIQRELGARGYDAGQPDGICGVVTRAAIFAYEYDNGLVLTGKPSEALLTQIVLGSSSLQQNGARPGKTITPDGQALVINVKQQLAALGYQTGMAGGELTPEFARAIREFETDQKLPQSGRISGPMMSRLVRLQGQPKAHRAAVARATIH